MAKKATNRSDRWGRLLTRAEAAERLGVASQTLAVWKMNKQGPPYVMIGRFPRYPETELDEWRLDQLVGPGCVAN